MRYEFTAGVVSFEFLLIVPCRYLRTMTNRNMAHVEIRGRINNEYLCSYLRTLIGLFPRKIKTQDKDNHSLSGALC
jgi:hypothetical protein